MTSLRERIHVLDLVVIDDVVREADMDELRPHLAGRALVKVLLSPRLDVAIERNRVRTDKAFDPATLVPHTVRLHRLLLEGCRPEDGWVVVDTSDMHPEAAVSELIRGSTSAAPHGSVAGAAPTPAAGVCPACGEWSEPWDVRAEAELMRCPHCGYEAAFLRLPLFVITGASGSGKTMLGERLVRELRGECGVLDRDLLWRSEFSGRLEEFKEDV